MVIWVVINTCTELYSAKRENAGLVLYSSEIQSKGNKALTGEENIIPFVSLSENESIKKIKTILLAFSSTYEFSKSYLIS